MSGDWISPLAVVFMRAVPQEPFPDSVFWIRKYMATNKYGATMIHAAQHE